MPLVLLSTVIALASMAASAGTLVRHLAAAERQGGTAAVGEYRLGMTREEVRRVASCAPYQDVAGTGGLECPNFKLDDKTINISFVFRGGTLHRIQLWFYEGPSEAAAREATSRLIAYLGRWGTVRSNELAGGSTVTADAVFGALRARNQSKQGARVQVLTPPVTTPPYVHGSVTHVGMGYYVFAFLLASPGD